MEAIEIDTYFGDKHVHIEIGVTMGAGEVFHVTVNKYYNGRIWKSNDGWRHDINPKTKTLVDDVQILLYLIEEKLMEPDFNHLFG